MTGTKAEMLETGEQERIERSSMQSQETLRDFVAYILTSARGLYREPAHYGPMRLVDSMERVLKMFRELGISDEVMEQCLESVRKNHWKAGMDAEGFAESLDGSISAMVDLSIATRK